jgi:hypothetical protein
LLIHVLILLGRTWQRRLWRAWACPPNSGHCEIPLGQVATSLFSSYT